MSPDEHKGRPGREAAPDDDERPGSGNVTASVDDAADVWQTIRAGWTRAGDAMPRPGSLAWLMLADDDPVRVAAAAAADLGADATLRRHGPSAARLLAEASA